MPNRCWMLVRVGFLEGLSSHDLDRLVGETKRQVFGIWREGQIVGEQLAIDLGYLQHFFGLQVDQPQQPVLRESDDAVASWVDSEIDDLFIALR